MLDISEKKVFADALKDSIRVKYLQHIEELDLYVIHIVRDVRGSISSIMKNNKIKDPAVAAKHWLILNMNSERAKRYVPASRWIRITYDELCLAVQTTMDCIADFIGIPRAVIPENIYEVEHHILGNRMRMRRSSSIILDESWKNKLTQHDLNIIARIAGDMNRYFGHAWP